MKLNKFFLLAFLMALTVTSCLNQYERELTGEYEVKTYEFVKKRALPVNRLPKLILKNNRTFVIVDDGQEIRGNWEADDNGDWTYIILYKGENFFKVTEKIAEGRISGRGGEVIDWFICYSENILTNYRGLSFVKK